MSLRCEALESRDLLSTLTAFSEVEINDTLNAAQDLGNLGTTGGATVSGAIGNSPAGAADVDWYRFSLAGATRLDLGAAASAGGGAFAPVLSLYNSDPGDFSDPYDPFGHRLLGQDDGAAHGGSAALEMSLTPGTYYVAVSGSGNWYFNPFLAASGLAGETGAYALVLQTQDLGLGPQDGSVVLSTDPASGALLNHSPFVLRADLSVALNPASVALGQDVRLLYSADANVSQDGQAVRLAGYNLGVAGTELQLFPAAPLRPGYYELVLTSHLRDVNGLSLGQSLAHPGGQDFQATFIVGRGGADDTPTTAHPLGDVTDTGVQVSGALGDDPTDRVPFDPSDVNMYHFTIAGPGRFALTAEVFAGRIGSSLDPALSLFEVDPNTHRLQLVAENDNTLNPALATNGNLPLFADPALQVGLTAGDYYLAVSSSGNMPNPSAGLLPGTHGIFNPTVSHSGHTGSSRGDYVLNLAVVADDVPPEVVSVTPADGTTLQGPPTQIVVQFSEPVNLQTLSFNAYEQTSQTSLASVFVQAADGTRYSPRLVAWDGTTNQATFLMLDGLPNGAYQLHLAGPLGLADFAGNPLVGNDASGDYVGSFRVAGRSRGTNGNPLFWTDQEPNDTLKQAQDLGVLFPSELHAGVTVTRSAVTGNKSPGDSADYYQFQVLQGRPYSFDLSGSLPAGVSLALFDASGNRVRASVLHFGHILKAVLAPGSYVIEVGAWTPDESGSVAYQLAFVLGGSGDNPTPLTSGPAPLVRIRLADLTSPGVLPPSPPARADSVGPVTPASLPSGNVPSGVLWVLGSGPLGPPSGPDTVPASLHSGTELAGGPNPGAQQPLLTWALLGQSGAAETDLPEQSVRDSQLLAYAFDPKAEAAGIAMAGSIADGPGDADLIAPAFLLPGGALAEGGPLPVADEAAPLRRALKPEPTRAAALWVADEHNGWMPVLAAIATYAALRYRRPRSEEERRA